MSQQQQQPPPFDLQAYISRYDPHSETSLSRLLFLAHHFHEDDHHTNTNISNNVDSTGDNDDSASITRQAFELAVERMIQSGNHRRYLEEYGAVVEPASSGIPSTKGETLEHRGTPLRTPSSSSNQTSIASPHTNSHPHHNQPSKHIIQHYLDYNAPFVRQSKLDSAISLETMEARLGTAQSHLMKESIRSALLALAEFHRERGELREAWRRVARSREYCANGQQHTQVCLLLVELCVDLRDWSSVRDTISRAEHTVMSNTTDNNNNNIDIDNDPLFHQKLRAAQALAHLAEGRYLEAAKTFTSISGELTTQFHSVISAEDLALYGSLLGLATLDRGQLHCLVIDGVFKGRLELVPAMREALRHYSRAEYGQCLSLLQNTIQRDLLLDIHLHTHVPILLDMIRNRCIVQYFQPYSCVSLEKMGVVFGCTPKEMWEVVAKLISNGGVDGMELGKGARINALRPCIGIQLRRGFCFGKFGGDPGGGVDFGFSGSAGSALGIWLWRGFCFGGFGGDPGGEDSICVDCGFDGSGSKSALGIRLQRGFCFGVLRFRAERISIHCSFGGSSSALEIWLRRGY